MRTAFRRRRAVAGAGSHAQSSIWHATGAIRFLFRIKMQHHSCDFAPISTFRIRVEQAQMRDEVLLIVRGQYGIRERGIGDMGIKRRLLHGFSRNRLLIDQLCSWPWHIDDREAVNARE